MGRCHWGMLWVGAVALAGPVRGAAQAASAGAVQVQMRNLGFHLDSTIVLDLRFVRGELRRSDPAHAPFLDDKRSFILGIDTARIGISPTEGFLVAKRAPLGVLLDLVASFLDALEAEFELFPALENENGRDLAPPVSLTI